MSYHVLDIITVVLVSTALIMLIRINYTMVRVPQCEVANSIRTADEIVAYDDEDQPIYRHECHINGKIRKSPAFLVVAIPTLYRQYKNETAIYVTKTLKSFIKPLSTEQKNVVQFLVVLTDTESRKRKFMLDVIVESFQKELDEGQINIIGVPQRFYPNLYDIPATLNDGPSRMYWRSKQALDYAFIAGYAQHTCEYFMQTEDDATPVANYFDIISRDISNKSSEEKVAIPWDLKVKPWLSLFYMRMGYIGIVFPGSTLPFMANIIRSFRSGWPVDLLLRYLNNFSFLQYQQEEIFKHHGHLSSSKGTV